MSISTFLYKLLVSLLDRRARSQRGFTLTELLVVMIIIGILTALAFLGANSYATKARITKNSTYISEINRAQTDYWLESGNFATTLTDLATTAPAETNEYDFSVNATNTGTNQQALNIATPKPDQPSLPGIAGRVFIRPTGIPVAVYCVGNAPGEIPDMAAVENETQCPE